MICHSEMVVLCKRKFPLLVSGNTCSELLWWQHQDLTDWWLFTDWLTIPVNIHTFYCALECFPQELCSIWLLCSSSFVKLENFWILKYFFQIRHCRLVSYLIRFIWKLSEVLRAHEKHWPMFIVPGTW